MKNYRFWLLASIILHILISYQMRDVTQGKEGKGRKEIKDKVVKSIEESKDLTEEEKDQLIAISEDDFDSFIKKSEENANVSKIKVVLRESGDSETGDDSKLQEASAKCSDGEYEGVGVSYKFYNIVESVAEGYAADRAGIKANDVTVGYIDHDEPDRFVSGIGFRGAAGKGIDIFVKRDGKVIKFTMIREKICFRKKTIPNGGI